MARTTVQVPEEMMTQLKLIADAEGTTVSVMVRDAIARIIKEREGERLSNIIALFDGPPLLGGRHEEDVLAELGFGNPNPGENPA